MDGFEHPVEVKVVVKTLYSSIDYITHEANRQASNRNKT